MDINASRYHNAYHFAYVVGESSSITELPKSKIEKTISTSCYCNKDLYTTNNCNFIMHDKVNDFFIDKFSK